MTDDEPSSYARWNPLHITLRAARGLPSFRQQTLYAAFLKAFRTTRRDDFHIFEFSVQSNHLHLLVEAEDNDALARGMKTERRGHRLVSRPEDPAVTRAHGGTRQRFDAFSEMNLETIVSRRRRG